MKPAYYLRGLETSSRERIKTLQWLKLKKQLDYVYNRIPFYKELCDRHQVSPEQIRSWDDFFARWPIIRKADLIKDQTEHPPWGT
ncbi:MAG: phenylacetate--CoA ligase family protein, partial [Thermodesulfobacteriota bacterium]